ncbi:MAG: ABC transporter ATP-binding protein [Anaerovoracaceae bacterium]
MWKILRRYMTRRQWFYVAVCIAFIVVQVWLDLKLPDYMSEVTTLVETPGSKMSDILQQGGYMMLCALGSMVTSMIVGYFAAVVAAGLSKTLRDNVFDRILDYSMTEIGHFSTSSLINRDTNDITQIQNLVAMGLQAIIKAPILAVWAIVKISGKSWQWTLETAIAVLVILLTITLIFAVPRFTKIQTLNDKLNRVTREQITGVRVVRAYNAEEYQSDKFAGINDEITKNNLIAYRVMAIMSPGMTLINSGLTLAVYWVGAYMIEAAGVGEKLGVFSDMVVFSNYAMQVIMAFMLLNMIFILLPRAQASAKRITEVLDTEPSVNDGSRVDRSNEKETEEKGTVEFRSVSFKYSDDSGDVLENISFKAKKGETVAVIGATGSGKTTLISLIPRFYDATSGSVLVDGVDVKDYTQEALRDKIGYATQKASLFTGTIRSNITFGDCGHEIDDDTIKEAADISSSSEFLSKKEAGLDSEVDQGGANFSGGQKQRLSIARAIARKPEILIFDDSFSALDYKTDKTVRNALMENAADATKIIVAQRVGTIRDADRIIVLEHGRIAGMGTHDELMKSCEVYKEIALSQFSSEELGA